MNLIESKHFYDVNYSSKKPDAAYESDINGLMVCNVENNFTEKSQNISPLTGREELIGMKPKKNIKIRILSQRKKRIAEQQLSNDEGSVENSTDTSTHEYVETDSEIDSSEGSEQYCTDNSVIDNKAKKLGNNDCNGTHQFEKFGCEEYTSEDATSVSSSSDSPMIHIIQEMTAKCVVTSTIHINRKKVKNFNNTAKSPKDMTRWKNKLKIIDDNVCNEMLDETINYDEMEGKEQTGDIDSSPPASSPPTSSPPTDTFWTGELKAKPKYLERKMGKLLEKRLLRVFGQIDNVSPQMFSQLPNFRNSRENPQFPTNTPPVKPPRTFTSSSSKSSSDSVDANTATTVAMEDLHKSSKGSIVPQSSPGGGWIFDKTAKVTSKPTCPTFEEIDDIANIKSKKIGWASSLPKREDCVQVLNMLNYDYRMPSKMTSANLFPEPQAEVRCKEDIDQVDSSPRPVPPVRRSKLVDVTGKLSSSMYSTPVKRSRQFSSFSAPNSTSSVHSDMEICKKCRLQVIKPSTERKSFGKGAIKRTKLFFKASKNMLIRPKRSKANDDCENQFDLDPDDDLDDETPTKLNNTVEFNANNTPRIEKRTVKKLELTPKYSATDNIVESPRCILDKFLTSVKHTPPKKPIRQSLLHKDATRSPSNNEDESFNFNRVIESPKIKQTPSHMAKKGFKLSPKKLFRSTSDKRTDIRQANSYRSFETDQNDDLKLCISEYLREMNDKIDRTENNEKCQTLPRCQTRIRTLSSSSDAIDYMPQRQRVVQIDCHPEPIYSEIILTPSTAPHHIIVNNNPKAIYATVDKKKKLGATKSMSINVNEIRDADQDSLSQLPLNNNLADSILNMLDLMNLQRVAQSEKGDKQEEATRDNSNDDSNVKNCQIIEPIAMGLISEKFQQLAPKSDDKVTSDNTSIETYFTESICNDVIRGDSINNDIAAMIDQLENMDLISTIGCGLVEPECDAESVFDDDYADASSVHGNSGIFEGVSG